MGPNLRAVQFYFYCIIILFFSTASTSARDLEKLYKKAQFRFGDQKFHAYVADDQAGRAQGLMFIKSLPENLGMLFIFEEPQELSFWMKNTIMPLSIGFIDHQGVLFDIQEMKVAASLLDLQPPTYQSRGKALLALEMNTGWFTRHHVNKGSRIELIGPSPSSLLSQKLKPKKPSRH